MNDNNSNNRRSEMIKIEEMQIYRDLEFWLEGYDIVFNSREIRVGRKGLMIMASYVEESPEHTLINCLIAVGERGAIWMTAEISSNSEKKYLANYGYVSVWAENFDKELGHCFKLRANGIGAGIDPSDPWFEVLRDKEIFIKLGENLDLVEYFNALIVKAAELHESLEPKFE